MPTPTRAVLYLRGKDREGQRKLCREYARLNFEISGEPPVFEDEGTLGGPGPGLAALREAAGRGELDAVLCAEPSILCRSTAELLELASFFAARDIALIFAGERIDLSSAAGRSFLYAAETLIQLERKMAAANIRENMRALARTGRWLGGVTPTGYLSTRVSSPVKGERIFRLEVHAEQAKTVRLIFALFLEADSLAKVTQALAERGVETKNGRAFSRFTVRQILENPVYMRADETACTYFSRLGAEVCSPREAFDGKRGMMVYNKTAQAQGQANQSREIPEWIVAVGEHEGLIDAASWIAAQQQLSRNKSKTARRPKSDHGLLAELMLCGYCGGHMRPKLSKPPLPDAEPSFIYICERKEQSRSGECDVPNLHGVKADAALGAMLGALDMNEPDILPRMPRRPATPEAVAALQERIDGKKTAIAENDGGISKLVFSLIKAIDKSAYDEIIKQIDALHAENAALRAEVASMEVLIAPTPLDDLYRDTLRELLSAWEANVRVMSVSRRRAVLRVLLRSVTWDGEELLVHFAGGAQFAVKPY